MTEEYGLTPNGFVPKTGQVIADELAVALRASEAFGPQLDVASNTAMGQWIGADALQQSDQWQAALGVSKSWGLQGVGVQLDATFEPFGVFRLDATKARGYVRCYGTNTTVIPPAADPPLSGGVVRRLSDGALFNVQANPDGGDWVIASGYVDVLVEAQDAGALTVATGQIGGDTGSAPRTQCIVYSVSGWTGVWNPAAEGGGKPNLTNFVSGTAVETDAQYKARFLSRQSGPGSCTDVGIYRRVIQAKGADGNTFLTSAFVYSNRTADELGNGQPGNTFTVSVWPNSLTTVEKQAVIDAIGQNDPAGIACWPGPDYATVVTGTYTAANQQPIDLGFYYAVEEWVYWAISVFTKAATAPSDAAVEAQVREILDAYGDTLTVGSSVNPFAVAVLIAAIPGVYDAQVQVDTSGNPALVAKSTILAAAWPANSVLLEMSNDLIPRVDGQSADRSYVAVFAS